MWHMTMSLAASKAFRVSGGVVVGDLSGGVAFNNYLPVLNAAWHGIRHNH